MLERKVALIYLGSRGGGALLASNLARVGRFEEVFINKAILEEHNWMRKFNIIEIPRKVKVFSLLFSWRLRSKITNEIVNKTLDKKISSILIVMPHPWDQKIARKLQKERIRVIRIIHDANPHPGDFWPNKRTIRKLITESDHVICFNQEVIELTKSLGSNPATLVPLTVELSDLPNTRISTINEPYLLIIGRLKRYKGIEKFVEMWKELPNKQLKLVVAGEGKLNIKLPSEIQFINRWLKESEFSSLIRNAHGVILPYVECSQSGIVPIAKQFNLPTLISTNSNLAMQVKKEQLEYRSVNFENLGEFYRAFVEFETMTIEKYKTRSKTPRRSNFEPFLEKITTISQL